MATFYLDYEGGSDAADGTTFANRWKTITSGATAARIAPGDTIRVMGSPAPTSLGINATWTNKSVTVTLASALNVLITNCDAAWTASANVTSTADTSIYRTSTGSAKHVIAAGFTTGLASYVALGGAQDYSAYQGITLWVYVAVKTLAASELSIRLCSDAAGVTTVDTLALPAITQTGQWIPVYIDKGSALGASIQSIALYGDADNGAITVYLDNISTVKAAGADALNLASLIGKNTASEYWWALRSINGTALTIDSSPITAVATAGRGYYGTTEAVTTYKRETIKTDLVAANTTVVQAIQDDGTAGSLITFSGGWDRTAMTTQSLETWFDGRSGFGVGVSTNLKDYLSIDKIHGVRYYRAWLFDGPFCTIGTVYAAHCHLGLYFNAPDNLTVTAAHVWGSYLAGVENTNGSVWDISLLRIVSCAAASVQSGWSISSVNISGHWDIDVLDCHNSNWYGLTTSTNIASYVHIGTLSTNDNGQAGIFFSTAAAFHRWRIDTLNANSNGFDGAAFGGLAGELHIGDLNAATNGRYGLVIPSSYQGMLTVDSLVTTGNSTSGVNATQFGGITVIKKSSMAEATKVSLGSSGYSNGRLSFHNYNGTADDHRTYLISGGTGSGNATIFSETSVRHTASGIAWALSPKSTTYVTSLFPMVLSVAKIAVAASALVTVRMWGRRTNTGLTGFLRCRGGQIAGVSADVTDSMTAIADTWEELEITFTPSEKGVVEIEAVCYGGSTYTFYVDDLTVSQA